MLELIKSAAGAALDLVYPDGVSCALCGADLDAPGALCPECAEKLPMRCGPACPGCGRTVPRTGYCRMCHRYGPAADRGLAAWDYADAARTLLLAFKFEDHTGYAGLFAHGICQCVRASGLADEIGCVVPVPMHPLRRFFRGYNQSALLAQCIARELGKPLVRGVVTRPVYTRAAPRAGGGPAERHETALRSYRPGKGELAGMTVLLVDDILTSGATIRACSAILRKMGAMRVLSAVAAAVPE